MKRPEDLERRSRFTVDHDRYDIRDFNRLIKQVTDFNGSRQKLVDNIAGEPGYDVAADMYWAMWKVQPEQVEDKEIRPSRLVNKHVVGEAMDLPQYHELRRWTQGDDIGSALAFQKMEPDLEVLYDRLKEQQKLAEEYQQLMQQLIQARADQRTAEDIFNQWTEKEGEEDQEAKDKAEQEAKDAAQAAQELAEAVEAAKEELESSLAAETPEIRGALRDGMAKANADFEQMAAMSDMWGSEPGQLMRLPAQQRIDLANRMNSPKFRRIAQLFGPMKRFAFAEQKRKVTYVPEEIYDLELGNDIPQLLPQELLKLDVEEMELLFYKDFAERSLVQYQMRGFEKIAKGGIIYCHDGSGSMSGDREIWAKAVGLSLLHVAKKQKRSFYGIQFGSDSEIRIDDFRDSSKITAEAVIDFAEYYFGGGTSYMAPLTHALQILEAEHTSFGGVRADIVFATDGQAHISDDFMKTFKERQRKLGFKVWGISIGQEPSREPLATLCDGKVATISSLTSGEDIRGVFGGL